MRSIFFSDVHLGWKRSRPKALARFLFGKQPRHVYGVGDIIDGWKYPKKWRWKDGIWAVASELARMRRGGADLTWIAGNHDDFLRRGPHDLHGITVGDEAIHTAADGRRWLVIHGDRFDCFLRLRYSGLIYHVGDKLLDIFMWADGAISRFRGWMGLKRWSLAREAKKRVKLANSYLGDYEQVVSDYARERGCDGVICGHIHEAAHRTLPSGIEYLNCGCWVDGYRGSAVIEDDDGKMRLWQEEE